MLRHRLSAAVRFVTDSLPPHASSPTLRRRLLHLCSTESTCGCLARRHQCRPRKENSQEIDRKEARVNVIHYAVQEAFPECNRRLLQGILKMMHTIAAANAANIAPAIITTLLEEYENIFDILEMNPEEEVEEDGVNIDLDSQRKGKCVVLKTSTRQVREHISIFKCILMENSKEVITSSCRNMRGVGSVKVLLIMLLF